MDLKGPQIRSSSDMPTEHTAAHKHSYTLLCCRLRVKVSGSDCTAHRHTHTQYVSPREETGGCHGDMARQPPVHSHKTERKVSRAGRWAKGKTLETFLLKQKRLCNRCSFLCRHSFHFFLADFLSVSE